MKKYIVIAALFAASLISSQAANLSMFVRAGTLTNLLTFVNGQVKVTQVSVTPQGSTNSLIFLVDTPNGALTFTNAAYTNTLRYATNWIVQWTNFYGGVQYATNYALIDVTNNLVAATTNAWPTRMSLGALTGTTAIASGVNYYFYDGLYASNAPLSGDAIVTITYQQ